MVTSRAVAAAGGWYARSDGWTRAVTAMAIALAHTRATVTTPDAARAGASATPTRSITSQAQTRAVRCPMTMLWNRDVGCPGLLATATAVGPSAAKSQGCDVASVIAPAMRIRIADAVAPQAASLVTNRLRPFHVRLISRLSGIRGARARPVTAGVGTVGVIIVGLRPFAAARGSTHKDCVAAEPVTNSEQVRPLIGRPLAGTAPRRTASGRVALFPEIHVVLGDCAGALSASNRGELARRSRRGCRSGTRARWPAALRRHHRRPWHPRPHPSRRRNPPSPRRGLRPWNRPPTAPPRGTHRGPRLSHALR